MPGEYNYFFLKIARGQVGTMVAGEYQGWPATGEMKDSSLIVIESEVDGNKLGIEFNSDGTFTLGGWDEEGIWHPLTVRRECPLPHCQSAGHTQPFPLNQYQPEIP
jgi:hypothetical protein